MAVIGRRSTVCSSASRTNPAWAVLNTRQPSPKGQRSDHPAGDGVDEDGDADEALPCRHARKICDPQGIWAGCLELVVHLVIRLLRFRSGTAAAAMRARRHPVVDRVRIVFACRPLQAHLLHQPGHPCSAPRQCYSTITYCKDSTLQSCWSCKVGIRKTSGVQIAARRHAVQTLLEVESSNKTPGLDEGRGWDSVDD